MTKTDFKDFAKRCVIQIRKETRDEEWGIFYSMLRKYILKFVRYRFLFDFEDLPKVSDKKWEVFKDKKCV